MLNIVYLVSTLKRAGPTNQLYNLLRYLDYDYYRPSVITLSGEPQESRWSDFRKLGIELYSLGLSRPAGFLLGRSIFKKEVDRFKPDLMQSHGFRPDMFAASYSSQIPTVSTLRNYPQFDYPMTYGIAGRLIAWQHMKYMKKIRYCVGVSEAVCRNAKEYLGISNMLPIHNGIDREMYFEINSEEKIELRKKFGLPLNSLIWISAGNLTELKNPMFLIDVWKRHFKKNNKHHLLFIGGGTLQDACRSAGAGNDNIHFTGRVSDVNRYLQASDYILSASKSEGLPNAVLEAMACGLPILVSDIPAHREVWDFNKATGRLFEPDSEASFLGAFADLVSTDYDLLAGNAVSLVKERFNAKAMSEKYQELYRQIRTGSSIV